MIEKELRGAMNGMDDRLRQVLTIVLLYLHKLNFEKLETVPPLISLSRSTLAILLAN